MFLLQSALHSQLGTESTIKVVSTLNRSPFVAS
jgi:hypothetical protein